MLPAQQANAPGPSSPKWALVRHYVVLFTTDKDKKDRLWHDGTLSQQTYNGKLVLYDEAGIELYSRSASSSNASCPLLPDDTEMQMGPEYTVQIQRFERVSRMDVAPLLQHVETKRLQRAVAAQQAFGNSSSSVAKASSTPSRPAGHFISVSPAMSPDQADRKPLLARAGAAEVNNSPLPSKSSLPFRKGPKSPHAFVSPFKRKATDDQSKPAGAGAEHQRKRAASDQAGPLMGVDKTS